MHARVILSCTSSYKEYTNIIALQMIAFTGTGYLNTKKDVFIFHPENYDTENRGQTHLLRVMDMATESEPGQHKVPDTPGGSHVFRFLNYE